MSAIPATSGHRWAGAARSMWVQAAAVSLVALPLLLLLDAYVRDSPRPRNDELIYELIAQTPFAAHTFPFAHRVGVPALVHILPFGHTFSFSLLAWLSSAACGGLVYALCRRFSTHGLLAAGLGVGFALSPVLLVVSVRQGRNVDPESMVIMLAGAIAIFDRRRAAFGVILLVGVFVREAALFLVPFAYAVWAERLWDARAARDTVLASLAGVLAYAALRLSVPALYRDRVPGYDSLLGGRVTILRRSFANIGVPLRRMAFAFGPLWLFAPFALRDLSWARRGLVLIACCLVSMTFAFDWGRIIFLAAPVIVVAAAWVLNPRPRLALAVVVALLAFDVSYAVYLEDFGGAQNGIIDTGHTSYPVR